MSDFNMTGERLQFNNNFKAISTPIEKKQPYKIGMGVVIVWIVFVIMIIAILVQDNKIDGLKSELSKQGDLQAKIEEQEILIQDLKTAYTDDLKMHHAKQGK